MKNHIKNCIKIMGLAAVPFGTAQAENDYSVVVISSDHGNGWEDVAIQSGYTNSMRNREGDVGFIHFYPGSPYKTVGLLRGWFLVRGIHDEKGGKVCVTDTKFSEGKSITCKDVEEQWKKEEMQLRDMFYRLIEYLEPKKTFTVDCKIYDLPKGCEVYHYSVLKSKFVNLFLVRDKQRSFGGSEYTLVIVAPDDCKAMRVESGIPTVVCGGEVKKLVSDNEVLDPSVRSRLLSVLGQKELSVKNWAVVWGSNTDIQSKTYTPEVFVKDCPFVQQAATIGHVFPGSDKEHWMADIWERFPGGFRLTAEDENRYMKRDGEGFSDFASNVEGFFELGVQQRNKFPELLHRGAKRKAIHHLKDLADDIKDELLKVPEEEKLEK